MPFYKAVARPSLLYGSETWVATERDMTGLEAAEMRFLRSVTGYTRLDKIRNERHKTRTGDLWNTRLETEIQTKLDQPPRKNGQHQTTEIRPQLQTSRKKRPWTPKETMAMRRYRNRSNALFHGGGRWWWWQYDDVKWLRLSGLIEQDNKVVLNFIFVVPCIVILGWGNPTRCNSMQIFIDW